MTKKKKTMRNEGKKRMTTMEKAIRNEHRRASRPFAEIRFLIERHSPSRLSAVAHPSHSRLSPKALGWL
jgi:hypothetical protein